MLSNYWFWGSSGEFGDILVNMVPEELFGGFRIGFGTGRLTSLFLFWIWIWIWFWFWPVNLVLEELSGDFGFGTGRLIWFFCFVLVLAGEFNTGRAFR